MTLEEILLDVDTRVPNTVSRDTKIRWINQLQRRLYRIFRYPPTTYQFQTVPQQTDYPLPFDVVEDQIIDVLLDGKALPRFAPGRRIPGQYAWTLYAGNLRIEPAPLSESTVELIYIPRYQDLVADTDEPGFPEDFHEMLVVGCASRVANAVGDRNLADSLSQEFTQMVSEAMILFRPPYEPAAPTTILPWTR